MQAILSSIASKYQKYCAGLLQISETPPENWTNQRMGLSLEPDYAFIASKAADDDEQITLVVRNIEPSHFIRIQRYDDFAVALEIGAQDKPTTVEIQCGNRTISMLRLLPGKPTLMIGDTYPVILSALSYHEVIIRFTGPIPQQIKFIGARIRDGVISQSLRDTLYYHTFPGQVFTISDGLGYMQSVSAAEVAGLIKHVYHVPQFFNLVEQS
jgi:hypothetical protein